MELLYQIAADALVVSHCAFVLFVVLGLTLILVGLARGWRWVRNFWFRLVHLLAILFVLGETWFGVVCPLTAWEKQLREMAGGGTYEGDFLARWIHPVLYYDLPSWVFTAAYTLFGLAVLATFLLARPDPPAKRSGAD